MLSMLDHFMFVGFNSDLAKIKILDDNVIDAKQGDQNLSPPSLGNI